MSSSFGDGSLGAALRRVGVGTMVFLMLHTALMPLAPAQAAEVSVAELARLLKDAGVATESGLGEIGTGMSHNIKDVLARSPGLRGSVSAADNAAGEFTNLVKANPTLRQAVYDRIKYLVTELGKRGSDLSALLRRGDTWAPLRHGNYGFVTAELLATLLAFAAVGVVTQVSFELAFAEFDAEMRNIEFAAERDAFNNNMRLLAVAIQEKGHRLCEGMTFGDALRRLRANMRDTGTPTRPFTGIVERCDEARGHPSISGGTDKKFLEAVQKKVSASGARIEISGSNLTFTFVPTPNMPDGSTGRMVMSPDTVTFHWQFTYRTGMVDSVDATCKLKTGTYLGPPPVGAKKLDSSWGGQLRCHTKRMRDGKTQSEADEDYTLMRHFDDKDQSWVITAVGLQDGIWRLR